MRIVAHIHLGLENPLDVVAHLTKQFETPLVPMEGMMFEDAAFAEPCEIVEVTINPTENQYFVFLGELTLKDESAALKAKERFEEFGWR